MSIGGTINGIPIVRATVVLPRSGIGYVDVHVADGAPIAGAVEVDIAGLILRGTVDEGGAYVEQGWYRVVLGANRWNVRIPNRPYRNEAGVKLRTVVADAAREAGELVDVAAVERRIGPAFPRPVGPASTVLNLFCPNAWYVDEIGVTRLGRRASAPIAVEHVVMNRAPDMRFYEIAPMSLVGVVPGVQIDGQTVAAVRHELTPQTLRSHLWCEMPDMGSTLSETMRAIVNALTVRHRFAARYEYRVEASSETHVDARPERRETGMPALANVPMWTGTPGAGGRPSVGSLCAVSFLDGDPTRPTVVGFEGPRGSSHVPRTAHLLADEVVELGGGIANPALVSPDGVVIRFNDDVAIPGLGVVKLAPGGAYSRVKA